MSHAPKYGVIRKIKYVFECPWYATVLKHEELIFNHNPGTRYPVTLGVENVKIYNTLVPTSKEENQVIFSNIDFNGGCQRIFNCSSELRKDNCDAAYLCLYYPTVKELYWVGLKAQEARFGGIVIQPMSFNNPIMKKERTKFLMNHLRKMVHLVGKWAIFLKRLYTEVSYRPGNLGAIHTLKHFKTVINNDPNKIIINNIKNY